MSPPLTVHNAEMKTAAVEVSTLTISGKQVTLSVFRQLQEAPLVADDGTLNGIPWGLVNYHPDKIRDDIAYGTGRIRMVPCEQGPHHRHVVWQAGVELRRSLVWRPEFDRYFWSEWGGDYVQAHYCSNKHDRPDWLRGVGGDVTFDVAGLRCEADNPTRHVGQECPTADDMRDTIQRFLADVDGEKARRQRHRDQWKALNDLPQLFIAV